MNAPANKQLMQHVFSELSKANSKPFLDSLADDVRWTITGTTGWSRTYDGKEAVLSDLLAPLFARFAGAYTATAHRIIAEDDLVVVEARGCVTTTAGLPYNNAYCWIYRIAEGKIKEITEYLDTELVTAALGQPGRSRDPSKPTFRLFNPDGLSTPRGYSHAVEIIGGKLVQIAGQVSLDPSGALVGENDFLAQVERVFKNLDTAVKAAGCTFADVVKLNCYCVESVKADQLPAFREIRDRFVNVEKPPVSTFVFVSRLVRPEWLIEIEATALV
jgi:enamine deaminase RidA (YjgF/YER057c/UK114 family)